jgi:hypothetical protein
MHTSKDTDAESGVRRKASPEASEPAAPQHTATPTAIPGLAVPPQAADQVRVHESPAADRVRAMAYATGRDIHVGGRSGPAVPHEAWHVVQQREGRVRSALVQDESARAGS